MIKMDNILHVFSLPSHHPFLVALIICSFFLFFLFGNHHHIKMTAAAAASKESKPEDFTGYLKVSQKLPTKSDLAKVANLPILDSKGEATPFSSLWTSQRTMIIFIRHFFCGVRIYLSISLSLDRARPLYALTTRKTPNSPKNRTARNTYAHYAKPCRPPISTLFHLA